MSVSYNYRIVDLMNDNTRPTYFLSRAMFRFGIQLVFASVMFRMKTKIIIDNGKQCRDM